MARLEVEYEQLQASNNALGPLVEEFVQATHAFNNALQAMTWQGQAAQAANNAIHNHNIPGKLVKTAQYMSETQEAITKIISQVQQNDSNGAAVMNAATNGNA